MIFSSLPIFIGMHRHDWNWTPLVHIELELRYLKNLQLLPCDARYEHLFTVTFVPCLSLEQTSHGSSYHVHPYPSPVRLQHAFGSQSSPKMFHPKGLKPHLVSIAFELPARLLSLVITRQCLLGICYILTCIFFVHLQFTGYRNRQSIFTWL